MEHSNMISRQRRPTVLLMVVALVLPGLISSAPRLPDENNLDRAFERLQEANPHFQDGVKAYEAGNPEAAEAAFQACLRKLPQHAHALYYLANLSYGDGDFFRARDHMESALYHFSFMQELSAYADSRTENRIDSFRATLERLWNSTRSCRDSREIEFAWNQLDKQESDLDLDARRRSRLADRLKAHYLYFSGNIYFQMKKVPEAFERYQAARSLDPRHAGAVNNVIAILHGAGRSSQAMEVLRRAEEDGLDEQLNLKLIEMVHRALGRPTEGILSETIGPLSDSSCEAHRFALAYHPADSMALPIFVNAYILFDNITLQAVIIDPGVPDDRIESFIRERGLRVSAVLLTHGHPDHIGAAPHYSGLFKAPIGIHARDADRLDSPAGFLIRGGEDMNFNGLRIRALATPGHTPGGVCFLSEGLLFTGDTLFRGDIGRVWGDERISAEQARNLLLDGIRTQILVLPDETRICPGHGKTTTLRREKAENPFLR